MAIRCEPSAQKGRLNNLLSYNTLETQFFCNYLENKTTPDLILRANEAETPLAITNCSLFTLYRFILLAMSPFSCYLFPGKTFDLPQISIFKDKKSLKAAFFHHYSTIEFCSREGNLLSSVRLNLEPGHMITSF